MESARRDGARSGEASRSPSGGPHGRTGESFVYEGTGIPLVRLARNTWRVHPTGAGQTLLTSDAEVVLKGGLATRVLAPLVAWQSRRLGRRSLAAFKHLVEHGTQPTVRHARLPRAPATC